MAHRVGFPRVSARRAGRRDPGSVNIDSGTNCLDVSYQGALIMTHRDGFPRLSARSAWRGDPGSAGGFAEASAGHRKPCAPSQSYTPSESLGKPPFRSRRRTAGGRRKASTMSRIARGFPPTRRIACTISMGHYQRSLV